MNPIDISKYLLESGGVIMWPLAATSFFIWFLLVYRLLDLSVNKFCDNLDVTLLGNWLCSGNSIQTIEEFTNLRGVQLTLFQKLGKFSCDELAQHLELVIQECERNITSDKRLIRTLINVAPLLGLLGTVWGMIATFNVIGILGTSEPRMLAHGISQAMLTTQAGLLIAVPSIFVEKRATRRENWILHKIEENRLILLQCLGDTMLNSKIKS